MFVKHLHMRMVGEVPGEVVRQHPVLINIQSYNNKGRGCHSRAPFRFIHHGKIVETFGSKKHIGRLEQVLFNFAISFQLRFYFRVKFTILIKMNRLQIQGICLNVRLGIQPGLEFGDIFKKYFQYKH